MLPHLLHKSSRACSRFLKLQPLYKMRKETLFHDEYHKKFDGPTTLCPKELSKIYEGFRKSDLNRDYLLDITEFNYFTKYYVGRTVPAVELEQLYKEVDQEGKGGITIGDMVTHLEKRFKAPTTETLKYIFCIHDKNEDGYMYLHELRAALFFMGMPGGHSSLQRIFNKYDTDNDFQILFEEFLEIVKNEMPLLF